MTEARRTRPVLATVLSLWEVLVVVTAIAGRVAIRILHGGHHAARVSHRVIPSSPLHTEGMVLGCALAIAGAIALWRMHRSAFFFLAARFAVELFLFVLALASHAKPLGSLTSLFVFGIDLFALILNAAIAWYAYRVTAPKRRVHRRRRRRPATSEAAEEAAPESSPTTEEAPLTTSQFYLSRDHKQMIRKD